MSTKTYYVVTDNEQTAIYTTIVGDEYAPTEAEVQAAIDAEWSDSEMRSGDWYCHECTRALYDAVETRGGDLAWGKLVSGVHCTTDEEDAEKERYTAAPY